MTLLDIVKYIPLFFAGMCWLGAIMDGLNDKQPALERYASSASASVFGVLNVAIYFVIIWWGRW